MSQEYEQELEEKLQQSKISCGNNSTGAEVKDLTEMSSKQFFLESWWQELGR